VEKVKKTVKKAFKNADELVADIVAKRSSIRKVLDADAGKAYAKKYFDKVVKNGNFEDWYENTFKKYDLKNEPLNFEVHHVIPINVLNKSPKLKELLYWAQKNGKQFDFNSVDNGIPLPKKRIKYDISGHSKHPKYDSAIEGKIHNILDNSLLDEGDKFNELRQLINNAKNKLEEEVLLGTRDVNEIIDL